MKAIVRAVLEQEWLILIRALIKVVPQFVMDGYKIFRPNLDAHFDTNIVLIVDVPGAGMANHVPIGGLYEQRSLPESLRQRIEAQRLVEILAVFHHAPRIKILCLQQLRKVVTAAVFRQAQQWKNIAPRLCPGISKEVSAHGPIWCYHLRPIFLRKPRPHERVKRKIKRTHLLPKPVHVSAKLLWRHVVSSAPQHAGIFEPHIAGALVRKLHEPRIPLAHGSADCVPPCPEFF